VADDNQLGDRVIFTLSLKSRSQEDSFAKVYRNQEAVIEKVSDQRYVAHIFQTEVKQDFI
jgi:hypothetical protein